jgi:hypothetical protein
MSYFIADYVLYQSKEKSLPTESFSSGRLNVFITDGSDVQNHFSVSYLVCFAELHQLIVDNPAWLQYYSKLFSNFSKSYKASSPRIGVRRVAGHTPNKKV